MEKNITQLKLSLVLRLSLFIMLLMLLLLISHQRIMSLSAAAIEQMLTLNVVGRQRTLVQQYARATNLALLALSVADAQALEQQKAEALNTAHLLEATNRALLEGGQVMVADIIINLPPAEDPELKQHLTESAQLWNEAKETANRIFSETAPNLRSNEQVRRLQEVSGQLTAEFDHILALMGRQSRERIERLEFQQKLITIGGGALFALLLLFVYRMIIIPLAEAIKNLRQSEEQHKTLYASAPVGLWQASFADGKLVKVNRTLAEMLGYDGEKQLLKEGTLATLFPPGGEKAFINWLAQHGEVTEFESAIRRRDGAEIFIVISARLYRERGLIEGAAVDLTDRRQAEAALAAANERLEASNKELEAFSYSVSHDLRAPLRALDGFSRLLLDNYAAHLPEEARRYQQRVRDNALRMGRLIDDLLAFSRLGRYPLRKRPVVVSDLARQALAELHAEQDGRQLQIIMHELPDCSGDPALLKQVFINLLSNALKYTRGRNAARIEVGSYTADGTAVYFVKDNGAGFDMKYAHKLFGVFQRLHRAEEYEGTGVGLAIVQRIIQRHGGRIWAEAEVDKGATFYFTLEDGAPVDATRREALS
jgi:PAS domain S-box-containing protein